MGDERHHSAMRETDEWLRRVAVMGPILAFIFGWGTGVISAALLFRDHEKRITSIENWRGANTRTVFRDGQ